MERVILFFVMLAMMIAVGASAFAYTSDGNRDGMMSNGNHDSMMSNHDSMMNGRSGMMHDHDDMMNGTKGKMHRNHKHEHGC